MTYVASLIHWIDSLAATSGGKTIPTYQRIWSDRFGPPSEEDLAALARFRRARHSRRAQRLCSRTDPAGGVSPGFGWRLRFLHTMLESRDLSGFMESIRPCLEDEEAEGLDSAIEHFRPGFDSFWRESAYLTRFERRYRDYLRRGEMPHYLGEVARFLGVDPGAAPPPVLCFVSLPARGSTHAQQLGRYLLIEVRPVDTPLDQVQVVSHEATHYLFDLIPAERRQALAARARASGDAAEEAWLLLQEALPTAFGQGLAVARLTPWEFSVKSVWYHTPEIDRYAKRLFPIVRRALEQAETIDGGFIDLAVAAHVEDR